MYIPYIVGNISYRLVLAIQVLIHKENANIQAETIILLIIHTVL